jgi:hypothetical protein
MLRFYEQVDNIFMRKGGIAGILKRTIEACEATNSTILLALLTTSKDTAQRLSLPMERSSLNIPENLLIIIGFVENNYLSIVSTFPPIVSTFSRQGD